MIEFSLLADGLLPRLLAALYRYPRGEMGKFVTVMLTLIALILACWLIALLSKRFGGERTINNPRKLFKSLCRAHRLDHNQRRLLLALAQTHHLPQAATLFLRPDLFNDSFLGPPLAAHAVQIRLLRQRLFQTAPLPANPAKSA